MQRRIALVHLAVNAAVTGFFLSIGPPVKYDIQRLHARLLLGYILKATCYILLYHIISYAYIQ